MPAVKLYELEPEQEDMTEQQMIHIHGMAALVSGIVLCIIAMFTIS